jgi:fermentation-respiration switch protein FrsA (DUF1100 family)
MGFKKSIFTIVICVMLVLCGCTGSRPHRTELGPRPTADGRLPGPPVAEVGKKVCTSPTACVVFVEFDDYGNFMSRAQLLGAVQAASDTAAANGTVLVYAHGWHNGAEHGSESVKAFQDMVERAAKLDRASYPSQLGRGNILGVYVGWRGDSIPSDGITKLASYALTFWDRKSAAHAIGQSGGAYELFLRLSAIRKINKASRLVVHGHSFGGAIVYSSIAQAMVEQIRRDAGDSPDEMEPLADLIVLINPAFEAMRLRPQLDLARSQEYKPNLPPRLIIITTEADQATGIAFPIGRAIATLPDAYADQHSPEQNRTAVGHYIPFVTHQLHEVAASDCHEKSGASTIAVVQPLEVLLRPDTSSLCIRPVVFRDAKRLLLQRCDKPGDCGAVAGSHYLMRGRVAEGLIPHRLPIMNIRTTDAVSTGHGDIRNSTLENFLVQLLVLALTSPGDIPMSPL